MLPSGPGIRVDTGVAAGRPIPPQFDSMIAKVIAWGRDRAEARARLARALRQTAAVIDGGTTNKSFLLDLLDRPEVLSGNADTTWLDGLMAAGYTPPRRLDVALLATAVQAQDAHVARQRERLFAAAERGRPEVADEAWHLLDVRAAGQSYRLRVAQSRTSRYHVELAGPDGAAAAVDVDAARTGRFERRLTVAGQTFSVLAVPQGPDYLIEVDGAVHRISGGEAGLVRAPAPAMVVALPVAVGDVVAAGDVVAVVESMKLETALRAPLAGRVREVLVAPNTQVEGGTKLVRLEPDEAVAGAAGDRVDLSALAGRATPDGGPATVAADALTSLRYLVLGYDIDEREARPLLAALAAARNELPPDDPGVLAGEIAVLQIFADLSSLYRNRRGADVRPGRDREIDPAGEEARNPQEYLYAYLRSRDAAAEGLPESFRARLRRALGHYGVTELEPGASGRDRAARAAQRAVPDVPGPPAGRRPGAGAAGAAAVAVAQPGLAAGGAPRVLPAGHRPAGAGHPAALPRRRRAGPAGPLHLLRRAADRRRAGARPAAGPRRARAAGRGHRPGRAGGPDRRDRRGRRAHPRRVRRRGTTT